MPNHRAFLLFSIIFLVLSGHELTAQQPQRSAAEIAGEAKVLFEKGDLEGALSRLQESVRLDPKAPSTYANMGIVQMRLGSFSAAETSYRRAAALEPSNGDHLAGLCHTLTAQRKHSEALKACDEAVRISPDSVFSVVARLEAYVIAGRDPQELVRLVDLALAKFGSDVAILGISSDIAIDIRNYSLAEELLLKLVEFQPQSARAWGRLAEVQLRLAKDVESLQSARNALRIDRADPYGNFAMGLIFFELGEHEEAIRSFELIPPDTKFLDEAVFYRAQAEARRSRPQAAVDLLRPLVERNPGDITFLFEYGRSLLMARRYQEAIPVFIRAIEFAPKMQDLHLGLAHAYLAVNDFKNAITYLETVNRMSPADENVQMLLNVARGRLNISARIDDFIKYVEARPGDVKNRVDLVHALAFLGRIAEAEKYIAEIYALDPSDPEVYHMIGVAYGEADDDEKALAAYRRALQKGENAAPYLGIAGIMMQRGNVEESSKAFDKVLELKPDAPDIMAGYAKMLRENGKRRESLAMYRRSLAIKPMNGNALFHAGVLSLKLGEPDAANTYLQQLRVADPQMADVLARGMKLRIWN